MIEIRENTVVVTGDFDGCLPVRVLQNNVLEFFLTANSRAVPEWEDMVTHCRISREILLDVVPSAVRAPSMNYGTQQIEIQEAFEGALWATSYGLMILHDCWATQCGNGRQIDSLNDSDPQVKDALGLLAYAEALFRRFHPWPGLFPNPENYPVEKKDAVEKANNLYVSAAAFSLAHEFSHVCLGHGDASYHSLLKKAHTNPAKLTPDEIALLKQRENDADRNAVSHFLSELDSDSEKTVHLFGILITYLCLLIGTRDCSQLESLTHPDLGTRILNILSCDILDEGFRDSLRGAAILALTYSLGRQGVSLKGCQFDDSESALKYYLDRFDELRSQHT